MQDISSSIQNHMDVVFFIYGLAFFALGLVILVQPKEKSQYELSHFIRLLALFGLVHGALEWMDLWKIVRGGSPALDLLKAVFLFASYVFLFEFGRRFARVVCGRIPAVASPARAVLGAPIYGVVALGFLFELLVIPDAVLAISIASRYFLGFAGSFLAGIGFLLSLNNKLLRQTEKSAHFWSVKYFVLAAVSFFMYSVAGGLMVPPANVFPANVINDRWFLATFQFPVQLLRAACAVLAAIAVGNLLRLFHLEFRERLFSSLRLAKDSKDSVLEITSVLAEGVYALDRAGLVTFANHETEKLLGWTAAELLGRNGHETFHYKQADGTPISFESCPVHQTLRTGRPYRSPDDCLVRKDGSIIPVSIASSPILRDGKVAGSVIAFHDITERKQAEAELRIAAKAFESHEGMFITDAAKVIQRVNRAFTEVTGYSAENALGKSPAILNSGKHDAGFFREMHETLKRAGYWQGEIWNRRKNGEIYPGWQIITAVYDPSGQVSHYISTFADISERKRAEERISNLAFYDPLTQLPNRRLLVDRLKQALLTSARDKRQGALLFIDLDNFKSLNDTQGHDTGDLLLVETANRLQACIREGDTAARLGGDEFIVLLDDLDPDEPTAAARAEATGEKILFALGQACTLNGYEYRGTASIGITLFRGTIKTADEMLKRADAAMYQAKAEGRNTVRFFDPALQALVMARVAMEAELRRAVSGKTQFLLYYQAQVDSTGRLSGAEALVRWQHPERGMLTPTEFIPLAEETGLILPLGHWVLKTACQQLALWAAQPETACLTLAVNVSAKQLRLPTFVDEVCALVDRFGVNPARLKLEITESMLLDNVDEIIEKMTALQARGINFSMDDFGTGYSSLSYLKRLPLYQLKIDQSFVRDVLTDPNGATIAKIIVSLARSMNLAVIAEGVETEAQREFLDLNGCHAFQGYLFSKPIPAKEFEQLVGNHAC